MGTSWGSADGGKRWSPVIGIWYGDQPTRWWVIFHGWNLDECYRWIIMTSYWGRKWASSQTYPPIKHGNQKSLIQRYVSLAIRGFPIAIFDDTRGQKSIDIPSALHIPFIFPWYSHHYIPIIPNINHDYHISMIFPYFPCTIVIILYQISTMINIVHCYDPMNFLDLWRRFEPCLPQLQVMVGDQCQLPATVLSQEAQTKGLDISMFDRSLVILGPLGWGAGRVSWENPQMWKLAMWQTTQLKLWSIAKDCCRWAWNTPSSPTSTAPWQTAQDVWMLPWKAPRNDLFGHSWCSIHGFCWWKSSYWWVKFAAASKSPIQQDSHISIGLHISFCRNLSISETE